MIFTQKILRNIGTFVEKIARNFGAKIFFDGGGGEGHRLLAVQVRESANLDEPGRGVEEESKKAKFAWTLFIDCTYWLVRFFLRL